MKGIVWVNGPKAYNEGYRSGTLVRWRNGSVEMLSESNLQGGGCDCCGKRVVMIDDPSDTDVVAYSESLCDDIDALIAKETK